MALLLHRNAVFLHIPKTGGMWVSASLRDLGLVRCRVASKHADFARVVQCFDHYPGRWLEAVFKAGPAWQAEARRAYKFCFVRHPLAWYESYWRFMRGRGWNAWGVNRRGRPRWHPNAPLDGLGDDDFNRFMKNVMAKRPGYVADMYNWYATDAVDFVGKQESLADDLSRVLMHLGVAHDMQTLRERARVNVSAGTGSEPVWDAALRREIADAERAAFERFGYTLSHEDDERRAS